MSAQLVTFSDFSTSTQNSCSWYDLLPGKVRISDMPATPDRDSIIAAIENDATSCTEAQLDILAAHVLNADTGTIARARWQHCSEQLSRLMAFHLTATGTRSVRMRAQRLHYYIQHLIAEAQPIQGALVQREETLTYSKPWDYLQHATGTWYISCDAENIHWHDGNGNTKHVTYGLPTQLDAVDDAWLCIGSLYSHGCTLTNGDTWQHIDHDAPILTVWNHEGQRYFLDHMAAIWCEHPRQKIAQLPCTQVHFARMYGGTLYALNNGEFGAIWLYDLASGTITHQPTSGVWVANDIAVGDNGYYLIDKQQGYVFKFDRQWQLIDKALAFGDGPGRLWDPVAIRIEGDTLHVISWVNGKHTTLRRF